MEERHAGLSPLAMTKVDFGTQPPLENSVCLVVKTTV